MEVPFFFSRGHNSRFLQEITIDVSPNNRVIIREIDLNIFPKATWIVIPRCFTVSESLEDRITG